MPTKPSKKEEKQIPLKLYRSETDRIIGGVAGGLGEYFTIDPVIIRIIFVALTVFGGGGIPLYLILWVVIPTQSRTQSNTQDVVRENVEEMKGKANAWVGDMKTFSQRKKSRSWLGFLIILIGFVFLFDALGMVSFVTVRRLWPLLIIVLGFMILFQGEEK